MYQNNCLHYNNISNNNINDDSKYHNNTKSSNNNYYNNDNIIFNNTQPSNNNQNNINQLFNYRNKDNKNNNHNHHSNHRNNNNNNLLNNIYNNNIYITNNQYNNNIYNNIINNNNSSRSNQIGNINNNMFNNDINKEEELEIKELNENKKIDEDFTKKYMKIIENMEILFYFEISDKEIIEIIKHLTLGPSLTIFEAMNLIYREAQIFKTIRFIGSNKRKKDDFKINIFDEEDNNKDLINIMEKYKIKNDDKNLEKYWLYIDNSDRRRELLKDENGYYNYIPFLSNNKDDIYAKNENELSYHYLYYKTQLCKQCDLSNENNKENALCPYSHNILKDFRIIYDYKDNRVIEFMLLLLDSNLFKFENYLKYIPMNLSSEFNINTFKVHKCMDENCKKDYHVCPYYHSGIDEDQPRRPHFLFKYSDKPCEECFDEKQKKYYPNNCKYGIFCHYLHNSNEDNYHPNHFRKVYKCQHEKMNGKCKYSKICYCAHSDFYNREFEKEKESKINEDIEDDEKIKEIKEKKEKIENLIIECKKIFCRKCNDIPKNGEFSYFIDCKHFLCNNCFKKLIKEKKNSENKKIFCPFCLKNVKKNKVVFLKLNKKEEE